MTRRASRGRSAAPRFAPASSSTPGRPSGTGSRAAARRSRTSPTTSRLSQARSRAARPTGSRAAPSLPGPTSCSTTRSTPRRSTRHASAGATRASRTRLPSRRPWTRGGSCSSTTTPGTTTRASRSWRPARAPSPDRTESRRRRSRVKGWCSSCGELLVDELPHHGADRDPPHEHAEHGEEGDPRDGGPAHPPEGGVPHELDGVVERVELREHLRPVRQLADREERARHEEERGENGAHDVAEVLDRFREARDADAEARPPEAGDPPDERHREHPPRRVEPEHHRDEHRDAAVDAGAGSDPERLRRDELLGVDGRGEDRVVRVLELVLDEGPEHRRERAREKHRRRDGSGTDELHVVIAADAADERAEAEAEGEQVNRRLDRRRERRRAPVRREVDDLAHQDARDRGALEAAETAPLRCLSGGHQPISSPVSSTNTSSRFAGLRSPSGAYPFAPPTPRIATLVPVRRVRSPAAPACASTSASRPGPP